MASDLDGRRPHELRKLQCDLGVLSNCDGSAFVQLGNTQMLASVQGPAENDLASTSHDKASVNCEYTIASFAKGERRAIHKTDRRNQEFASLLKHSFEAVILLHLYPRASISINIQVLQVDGGEKTAAINAATLALMNAGIPLSDFLCACSVGYIEKNALLDVNLTELGSRGPELLLAALPNSNASSLILMTSTLPSKALKEVMDLALEGCSLVHEQLQQATKKHSFQLLHSRGFLSS